MANHPPAFTRKENISMHSKNKSTYAASLNLSGQKPCNDSFISFKNLEEAHGIIPYGMTNDYMFRAVLQSNDKVLQGLICSLLHLSKREITSIEIINPVILGKSVENKEFRLDINVLLNNNTVINLEMQVANEMNWPNRSILYLCRSFDNPKHGQDYRETMSAIHIGFLDFTLFKECPEFYATYKLINVKNHHIYSDNFILNVVNLSRIDLATKEDRAYGIDHWAALFKAKTWEELKMIAEKDKDIEEAARSLFQFCTDEQVRKLCRDREEYYQDLRNYEREIERMKKVIAEKEAEMDIALLEKDAAILEKDRMIEKLLEENRALKG